MAIGREVSVNASPAPIAIAEAGKVRFPETVGTTSLDRPTLTGRVQGVALVALNYCQASCAHCYNRSSPKGKDFLDPHRVMLFLDWWHDNAGVLKYLGVTGGEPFLHPQLIDFVRGGAERGLRVSCTTGAVGVSVGQVCSAVNAGLTELRVSWDIYHEPFISRSKFEAFVREVSGFTPVVKINLTSATPEAQFREIEWLDRVLPVHVGIVSSPVWSIGRAIAIETTWTPSPPPESKTCCAEFETITINYDGRIFPCCSIGGFSKELVLGTLFENFDLISPSQMYSRKPVFETLARNGWGDNLSCSPSNNKCLHCSCKLS